MPPVSWHCTVAHAAAGAAAASAIALPSMISLEIIACNTGPPLTTIFHHAWLGADNPWGSVFFLLWKAFDGLRSCLPMPQHNHRHCSTPRRIIPGYNGICEKLKEKTNHHSMVSIIERFSMNRGTWGPPMERRSWCPSTNDFAQCPTMKHGAWCTHWNMKHDVHSLYTKHDVYHLTWSMLFTIYLFCLFSFLYANLVVIHLRISTHWENTGFLILSWSLPYAYIFYMVHMANKECCAIGYVVIVEDWQ